MKSSRVFGAEGSRVCFIEGREVYVRHDDSITELKDDHLEWPVDGEMSAWEVVFEHMVYDRRLPVFNGCGVCMTSCEAEYYANQPQEAHPGEILLQKKTIQPKTKEHYKKTKKDTIIGCAHASLEEVIVFEEVVFLGITLFDVIEAIEPSLITASKPKPKKRKKRIIHHALYVNSVHEVKTDRSRQPRDRGHEKNKRRRFPKRIPLILEKKD
jgi:hypothetical protein